MKILIIGGNRFFGKKLTARLMQAGHNVTLLNRGNIDDGFGDKIHRLKCDRKNTDQLKNLVGHDRWDIVYDQVCYDADEARAACEIFGGKVGHYIFTSSMSVYDLGADLSEAVFDPLTHQFAQTANPKTEYAEAKRQCEAVFFQSSSLPVTAVRFPIVVGADDYTGRFQFHVNRIRTSQPMYFPAVQSQMSMISSDDAAAALEFLGLRTGSNAIGPVNVASIEPIALSEFIKVIESITHNKAVLAAAPDDTNHSPYGIGGDWYMNTGKLQALGFQAQAIQSWLPNEITSLQDQ